MKKSYRQKRVRYFPLACIVYLEEANVSNDLAASYRLSLVPDALQARTGSVVRLLLFGSLALGQVIIGLLQQHFGVSITIAIMWAGLVLIALIALANGQIRRAMYPQKQV